MVRERLEVEARGLNKIEKFNWENHLRHRQQSSREPSEQAVWQSGQWRAWAEAAGVSISISIVKEGTKRDKLSRGISKIKGKTTSRPALRDRYPRSEGQSCDPVSSPAGGGGGARFMVSSRVSLGSKLKRNGLPGCCSKW